MAGRSSLREGLGGLEILDSREIKGTAKDKQNFHGGLYGFIVLYRRFGSIGIAAYAKDPFGKEGILGNPSLDIGTPMNLGEERIRKIYEGLISFGDVLAYHMTMESERRCRKST